MLDNINEFFDRLFYDWTQTGIIVWLLISFLSIYFAWFVEIPSALSDNAGFPISVKYGVSILIPAITWYLIANKEWTADKFRGVGKRRRI